MTTFQEISILISFLALFISMITAYNNFYTGFKCELFTKPRIVLTQISGKPAIVIACDIINSGKKSGSIDDIVLKLIYKVSKSKSNDDYIESSSFFPKLMRDSYNIFETYTQKDFEPFQTISIGEKSSLEKYIVFTAGSDSFKPSIGVMKVKMYFRLSENPKWVGSKNQQNFTIDAESVELWSDGNVIIESNINYEYRNNLMNENF
jgi:hypothetical protein